MIPWWIRTQCTRCGAETREGDPKLAQLGARVLEIMMEARGAMPGIAEMRAQPAAAQQTIVRVRCNAYAEIDLALASLGLLGEEARDAEKAPRSDAAP